MMCHLRRMRGPRFMLNDESQHTAPLSHPSQSRAENV
ncbi:unnamed protein product [Ixodes pacificus]